MGRSTKWPRAVCPSMGVAALALLLALAGAVLRHPWHDELFTLRLAALQPHQVLAALANDSGPPLHYLLVRFVARWLEDGILIARLPSILAFAAIAGVLARAELRRSTRFPWAAALTMSWLPFLYFGTEARAYALLALANTLLWLEGPKWIDGGSWRRVPFILLAASLPLLHNTGALYLAALVGLLPFTTRRAELAGCLALASVPALAWLPTLVSQPRQSVDWMAGSRIGSDLWLLTPGGPFPSFYELDALVVPPLWSGLAGAMVLATTVVGMLRMRREPGSIEDRSVMLRALIGTTPALALAATAQLGFPTYFPGRTEAAAWPLLAMVVATSARLLGARMRLALLLPWLVIGVFTEVTWLWRLPERPLPPGIRAGVEIGRASAMNDRVLLVGLFELEVGHGLSTSAGRPIEIVTFPGDQATHPGWLEPVPPFAESLVNEARALRSRFEREGGRVWLVRSPGIPVEATLLPAFRGWKRELVHEDPAIVVELWTLPPRFDGTPPIATDRSSCQHAFVRNA